MTTPLDRMLDIRKYIKLDNLLHQEDNYSKDPRTLGDWMKQNPLSSSGKNPYYFYVHEIGHWLVHHTYNKSADILIRPKRNYFVTRSEPPDRIEWARDRFKAVKERLTGMVAGETIIEIVYGKEDSGAVWDLNRAIAYIERYTTSVQKIHPLHEQLADYPLTLLAPFHREARSIIEKNRKHIQTILGFMLKQKENGIQSIQFRGLHQLDPDYCNPYSEDKEYDPDIAEMKLWFPEKIKGMDREQILDRIESQTSGTGGLLTNLEIMSDVSC